MSEPDPRELAADYFRQAFESQKNGDYAQAIELYSRSIQIFPTAEAYTFRGWTHSFSGDYDRAIEDCYQAIRVDPETRIRPPVRYHSGTRDIERIL